METPSLIENIEHALTNLDQSVGYRQQSPVISFEAFLQILQEKPAASLRNVFQVFHDMMKAYMGEGRDEYPDDPESIHFVNYDCHKLLVDDTDHPFFADRLFANRLMNQVEALRRGAQQNKIYIFNGPPGCGKSTFLNNLLMKFEEYTKTPEGMRYEAIWRLDRRTLCSFADREAIPMLERMVQFMDGEGPEAGPGYRGGFDPDDLDKAMDVSDQVELALENENYIEVPCPSHDHPLLMIPKHYRRTFFDDLFANDEFKWKLFTEKEYEWVFRERPCTICSSIYWALMRRLKSPLKVLRMLFARPYHFKRRMGEGISVFNPGDRPVRQNIFTNALLQRRLNGLLRDSNLVKYIFSQYAKTNNGIYALMDIKQHNIERLIELHNIISEGVHKVEDIEENVNCLLMALMNPEDKKNIADFQSFSDRIEYINIPYVLDLNTEVSIYRNIFGRHIDDYFLPRVLHNFARVIISTRLNRRSDAMLDWIPEPRKYAKFCDESLLLLKMEIFTGHIPSWLTDEDRKRFTAKRRRRIIAEGENEGSQGLSGRDAIKIFNEFFSKYARQDRLITMSILRTFFTSVRKDLARAIPEGFLDCLQSMYDYTILEEVKESLYDYNEEQVARDIQNYLFAINFEVGTTQACHYTGDRLEITDDYLKGIELRLLGAGVTDRGRAEFRHETQRVYASRTLTQEIMLDGRVLGETALFKDLRERYVFNLKQKVLDPFLENENFRQAIKDFGTETYKTFDKRIQQDVDFLIDNLCRKRGYTQLGAKDVCIYVIDNNLAQKFAST